MQIFQEPLVKGSLQDALGSGLQQLLQLKLGQMQQRHLQQQQAKAFQQGGKPSWWAELDPVVQRELIKQQTQMQQANDFASLMGQDTQPEQTFMSQLNPTGEQNSMIPGQGQENLQKALSSLQSAFIPQASGHSYQEPVAPQPQRKQLDFDRILSNPNLKPDQRLRLEAMKLQKEATEEKGMASKFKETKAFRQATMENAKAARDRLHDLQRMEELDKTGKLDTPGYLEFLKRSGLDISALKEPESQEFEKLSAGFMRDAKSIFGSRISNFEVEQFLKAIPSLSQSPEGRKRVIANLKRVSRASLEHANAMKKIIADNKGVPPYDLMEKVDDIVEKKMDVLSNQFKKDLERPVPEGQNKWITGIQSIAGSAAGLPGALINKIGNIGANLLG